MIRIKFAAALDDKSFRDKRKYTLNDVAELSGILRPTLTRLVNKRTYNLSFDILEKLCRFLERSPGDLLELVDELTESEKVLK